MDDLLHCPICGNKLRTSHLNNKLLHPIGKIADYAERVCSEGYNHIVSLWTDKATSQIDLIKLSLNHKYSRFVEIDYINNKSRITCVKEGKYEYIEIPRLLDLDFNDLSAIKKTCSLFITFS